MISDATPPEVLQTLVDTWGVDSIRDAFEARWPSTGPDDPAETVAAFIERSALPTDDDPRVMPPVGRFLSALGVDPATATDDPPVVRILKDRVFVTYTGLLSITPEAFLRAASVNHLPDGWTPA